MAISRFKGGGTAPLRGQNDHPRAPPNGTHEALGHAPNPTRPAPEDPERVKIRRRDQYVGDGTSPDQAAQAEKIAR